MSAARKKIRDMTDGVTVQARAPNAKQTALWTQNDHSYRELISLQRESTGPANRRRSYFGVVQPFFFDPMMQIARPTCSELIKRSSFPSGKEGLAPRTEDR